MYGITYLPTSELIVPGLTIFGQYIQSFQYFPMYNRLNDNDTCN